MDFIYWIYATYANMQLIFVFFFWYSNLPFKYKLYRSFLRRFWFWKFLVHVVFTCYRGIYSNIALLWIYWVHTITSWYMDLAYYKITIIIIRLFLLAISHTIYLISHTPHVTALHIYMHIVYAKRRPCENYKLKSHSI